jgi:1,4-alpha-glucan branching enzyme
LNYHHEGFEWIDFNDHTNTVLCWMRKSKDPDDFTVFVGNFTPVVRKNYRVGVPKMGTYEEILNTDSAEFGGSDVLNGT